MAKRTRLTDTEVMELLRGGGRLAEARTVFSGEAARIENAQAQRDPPGSIELRRMEFEAVGRIAAAMALPELLAVLRKVEWCGTDYSGEPDDPLDACPSCDGLKPTEYATKTRKVVGHSSSCSLIAAILKAEALTGAADQIT